MGVQVRVVEHDSKNKTVIIVAEQNGKRVMKTPVKYTIRKKKEYRSSDQKRMQGFQ